MSQSNSQKALTIPGVDLEKLIGKGGMGRVYLAKQTYLGRQVAVKIIMPEESENAETRAQRFRREAKLLAGLSQPNIVACYDGGATKEGYFYLIMEYIEGPDLARFLRENGPVNERTALKVIIAVSEALNHALEQSIIHRDVKAENILLKPEKGRALSPSFPFEVKLADLGLAKYQDQRDAREQLTKKGVIFGTPCIMAPEQFQDATPIDYRVDIYALGCLLYQCLHASPPFGGASFSSIVAKKISGELPDMGPLEGKCSSATLELLKQLIAFDPADRPASYQEVINQGKACLKNLILQNETVEPKQRRGRGETCTLTQAVMQPDQQEKKSTKFKMALIFAIILTLASVGIISWLNTQPGPEKIRAEKPAKSLSKPVLPEVKLEETGKSLLGDDFLSRMENWKKEGTWGADEDGPGVVAIAGDQPALLTRPSPSGQGKWVCRARFQNAFELGAGFLLEKDRMVLLRIQNLEGQLLCSVSKMEGPEGSRKITPIPGNLIESINNDPQSPLTFSMEQKGLNVHFNVNNKKLGTIPVAGLNKGFFLFSHRGVAVFEDVEAFLPITPQH